MRAATVTPIRRARPLCRHCGRRPAMTRIRREWRIVKNHDVCRQCWRSWMDAIHAGRLAA